MTTIARPRPTPGTPPSTSTGRVRRLAEHGSGAASPRAKKILVSYMVTRHDGRQRHGVVAAHSLAAAAQVALADYNRHLEAAFEPVPRHLLRYLQKEAAARCDLQVLVPSEWCPGAFDPAPDSPAARRTVVWSDGLAAASLSFLAVEQETVGPPPR